MNKKFKTCMFGGFDRDDVIKFIENTAEETEIRLGKLDHACDLLKKDNDSLRDENDRLHDELELLQGKMETYEKERSGFHLDKQSAQEQQRVIDALRRRVAELEEENKSLRISSEDFKNLTEKLAQVEQGVNRCSDDYRLQAMGSLREVTAKQRQWCQEQLDHYMEMNREMARRLQDAQDNLASARHSVESISLDSLRSMLAGLDEIESQLN